MSRNRKLIIAAAVVLLALLMFKRSGDTARPRIEVFTVERGAVTDVLREVGELAPQDPILLQAPFSGEIKWLLQDGTWANKGERVVVFDEEALEQRVTQLRADLVDKKQQLRISKLQADHARIAELQRVENAKTDLKLAEIRHRILTTQPEGGDRLVELDAEVKPIEARLEKLQAELKPLEAHFRAARETYQAALQKWQEARSKLLELQMGADLKQAKSNPPKPNPQKPNTQHPKPTPLKTQNLTLEQAKADVQSLQETLDFARAERDAVRLPYESAVAALDAVDAEAQELYILIEIEKRGLPATRLAIDRDIAKLRLAESQRQAESGKRALEVGAISKARYDQLVADAEATAGRLEILEYRLEIASRPATEDQVAASEAALATARRAVDNAQAIFDREMNILSSEMAVVEAELAEAVGEMERDGKGFPDAIRGNITVLQAELDVLTDAEAARRTEILTEIDGLKKELVEAEANPPHIVVAPSDGLVRLRKRHGHENRLTDIGDSWEKGHTVAMLYPPGNMRVQVGINEVNYQRLKEGMTCTVRIPALDMEITGATVAHLSRIGRDRVETQGRWVNDQHTGIIEFSLSVDLRRDVPEFRQGMTVRLDIETERREDVLFLPAAAVEQGEAGFSVLVKARSDKRQPVKGAFFGDDVFILTDGLNEGDRVYRRYP